jgi:hypothetical protein
VSEVALCSGAQNETGVRTVLGVCPGMLNDGRGVMPLLYQNSMPISRLIVKKNYSILIFLKILLENQQKFLILK